MTGGSSKMALPQIMHCGKSSKIKCLFATTIAMTTFTELWRMRLQPSLQNYSRKCLIELGGAFDCVLKIMVNILIFLMFNAHAIDVTKFHL